MSRSSKKNSGHILIKAAAILFLLAFGVESYLNKELSVVQMAIFAATLIAAVLIIIMLNYSDFQRYGFLPVILISVYEIICHIVSGVNIIESFYYLAFILISIYFTTRVKKKKIKSKKS
ncbi:MAG: hypothetical protein K9J27_01645 [Bacteroidales bacterium]|nr:hypothetical protein [Bacteroidales bacterium]MCF8333269.1 hypothetical protein [Bacteroidales bacterium]